MCGCVVIMCMTNYLSCPFSSFVTETNFGGYQQCGGRMLLQGVGAGGG